MEKKFKDNAMLSDVVEFARQLLTLSIKEQNSEEKQQQRQMYRLIENPKNKVILASLLDQSFRSKNVYRIASQMNHILRDVGIPDYFSSSEKILTHIFMGIGRHVPQISVPKIIEKIKKDASRTVVFSDYKTIISHINKRNEEGIDVNINWLGESVFGEKYAEKRIEVLINLLKNPLIGYLSVKISSIYSKIRPIAFEFTVDEIVKRLTRLFRVAVENPIQFRNGRISPKFIHLDMEAYQDLHLTIDAFQKTLEQEEFDNYSAGIVLQAYLPESFSLLKKLSQWAIERCSMGKSPIKVRIVKGANMAMERTEAGMNGFLLAPFDNKLYVDANFKKMLEFSMKPERIKCLHVGIASHNIFDIAYGHALARRNDISEGYSFEMLHGMANALARTLVKKELPVLLYTPILPDDDFISGIAYLIRRLDENTTSQNYLRYASYLKPDTSDWQYLKSQFEDAYCHMDSVYEKPHRQMDRADEAVTEHEEKNQIGQSYSYSHEISTDFSSESNRLWMKNIMAQWKKCSDTPSIEIPIHLSGDIIFSDRKKRTIWDPNQHPYRVPVASYAMADEKDIDIAFKLAWEDSDGWQNLSSYSIFHLFKKGVIALKRKRGDLIGAMVSTMGIPFDIADEEVTAAVNILSFYPFSVLKLEEKSHIRRNPLGVIAVITSSESSLVDAASGIAAAICTGNRVILKPSKRAVLPSYILVKALWEAGIPQYVLSFLPFDVEKVNDRVLLHPHLCGMIFNGRKETYYRIARKRPHLWIKGQITGKNVTIVTEMADREQAISNVIRSAYRGKGKRKGNINFLILEKGLFHDTHFRDQLIDAVESIKYGSAWSPENEMGPYYYPPDESPQIEADWEDETGHPLCLKPNIEWTEQDCVKDPLIEAPQEVLKVVCARNMCEAIELADRYGNGATASLETLDDREIEKFKRTLQFGNLCVNRDTLTYSPMKNPMGGIGKSCKGSSIKSGTFHDILSFMDIREERFPLGCLLSESHFLWEIYEDMGRALYWGKFKKIENEIRKTRSAMESYIHNAQNFFLKENRYSHLQGVDNSIMFHPLSRIMIRVVSADSLFDVLARIIASRIADVDTVISIEKGLNNCVIDFLKGKYGRKIVGGTSLLFQSDSEIVSQLIKIEKIRYASKNSVPEEIFSAAIEAGCFIEYSKVLVDGWVELRHYFNNQSISHVYHRYGSLDKRERNIQ